MQSPAAKIAGSSVRAYQIPWFWSDQYDLKLQIVGLTGDHDQVVIRGDMAKRAFAAFYIKGDTIIAVDAINSPREFMASKALVANKTPVDLGRLADPEASIMEVAKD